MAYDKQVWIDDDGTLTVGTLVTAERMNHIEQGIDDAGSGVAQPVVWRNAWEPTVDYVVGDAVENEGGSYFAKVDVPGDPGNLEPYLDGITWGVIAERGLPGEPGEPGPQGDPGPAGPAPEFVGNWSAEVNYGANQVVLYEGSAYVARERDRAEHPADHRRRVRRMGAHRSQGRSR